MTSARREGETAQITLARLRGLRETLRPYDVVVDGQVLGRVNESETVTLHVRPGAHKVCLKIDWCRSPELAVTACDAVVVQLQCRAGGYGLGGTIIGRRHYIELAPAAETLSPQRTMAQELRLRAIGVGTIFLLMLFVFLPIALTAKFSSSVTAAVITAVIGISGVGVLFVQLPIRRSRLRQ